MWFLSSITMIINGALLVARLVVPVILLNETQQRKMPHPALWAAAGFFSPITAGIAYLAVTWLRDEVRKFLQG